ncbi:MAG TPA: acyltransferase, partial [Burkholderiaceae bacterium]|nr:acyltransferase [Burkholderiaceae bacterium]
MTAPSNTSAADGYEGFSSTKIFGSLDGLRALSVLAVVWHHTGGHAFEGWVGWVGSEGVTLFFAISGFLITSLLLREYDHRGHIDLRAFYVRRALRIFPLYYGVLLLYVLAVLVIEGDTAAGRAFFGNLVFFLTYTSNWFVPLDGRVIFYFAWSLAAEEQFYAIWPPVMRALGSPSNALRFALIVSLLLILVDVSSATWELPGLVWLTRAVAKVPLAIIFGVVTALCLHRRVGFQRLWPWLAASRWHPPCWMALAIIATALPGSPRPLVHAAFAATVASSVMRRDHVLAALLNWRPVAYLGTISYGVYLLHMLCKHAWMRVASLGGLELGPA